MALLALGAAARRRIGVVASAATTNESLLACEARAQTTQAWDGPRTDQKAYQQWQRLYIETKSGLPRDFTRR